MGPLYNNARVRAMRSFQSAGHARKPHQEIACKEKQAYAIITAAAMSASASLDPATQQKGTCRPLKPQVRDHVDRRSAGEACLMHRLHIRIPNRLPARIELSRRWRFQLFSAMRECTWSLGLGVWTRKRTVSLPRRRCSPLNSRLPPSVSSCRT